MTAQSPLKLTCRCSAPTRPLLCVEGCSYLCQRLIAERLLPVLESLSRICDSKGEHLAANWQDQQDARPWHKLARKIDMSAAIAALEGI